MKEEIEKLIELAEAENDDLTVMALCMVMGAKLARRERTLMQKLNEVNNQMMELIIAGSN